MKYIKTALVVIGIAAATALANSRPHTMQRQTEGNTVPRGVQGELLIGIVDISNPALASFNITNTGLATMHVEGSSLPPDGTHGSYAIAVEIDIADVVIDNIVSKSGTGTVYMFDVTAGTLIPLSTGPQTLLAGQRYMFRGDSGIAGDFSFTMSWQESVGPPQGADIDSLTISGHAALTSIEEEMFIRTSDSATASLTLFGPGELWMRAIANVSSSTLTLPLDPAGGVVVIPAGTHAVDLNGFAILEVDFFQGMPEDINMDGVVDVLDLLAVISAWSMP